MTVCWWYYCLTTLLRNKTSGTNVFYNSTRLLSRDCVLRGLKSNTLEVWDQIPPLEKTPDFGLSSRQTVCILYISTQICICYLLSSNYWQLELKIAYSKYKYFKWQYTALVTESNQNWKIYLHSYNYKSYLYSASGLGFFMLQIACTSTNWNLLSENNLRVTN